MFVHDQLQISDSKSVSGEGGPRLYLLNNYGLTAAPEEAYLFSNFTISLSGISLMVKQTDLTGARGGTWWGAVCGHIGVDWRCVDILDLIDQANCFSSQQFYRVGICWSDQIQCSKYKSSKNCHKTWHLILPKRIQKVWFSWYYLILTGINWY